MATSNEMTDLLTGTLVAVLMFGLAGMASAGLVAADLNTGGTDTGFSGGWAGSSNRMPIQAPDLTYANYAITQTGSPTYVYGGDSNTHQDRQDSRDLASAMSGEIWFSCLVHNGNVFAGLSFHTDTIAGGATAYLHSTANLRVLMSPSTLIVDLDGGTLPSGTGSFSVGTHLLLGQMTIGVGNDSLSVWVDPDVNAAGGPGALPAADFSSTGVDFVNSIARIGAPNVGGSAAGDTIDAIRLSDTATAFEDVTGVSGGPASTPGTLIYGK